MASDLIACAADLKIKGYVLFLKVTMESYLASLSLYWYQVVRGSDTRALNVRHLKGLEWLLC